MKFEQKEKPQTGSYRVKRKFALFPIKRAISNPETGINRTITYWLQYVYVVERYLNGWERCKFSPLVVGGEWVYENQKQAEEDLKIYLAELRQIDEMESRKTLGIYDTKHQKIAELPDAQINDWLEIILKSQDTHGQGIYVYIPNNVQIEMPDVPDWHFRPVRESVWAFCAYIYDPNYIPKTPKYHTNFRLPETL